MLSEFEVKRIAVPTDFSESANVAIDHAVDIAKKFGADIFLIHVLESGAYQGIFAPSNKTQYDQRENAQEKLQQDANELEAKTGINVSQSVVSGRVYEAIVSAVKKAEADLVVMGTHGASGWEEFFVGSNAYRVVTQSVCPVLSIQSGATKTELKNIIMPIDSTQESRQKVRQTAAFAKKYGSTVHIATLVTDDDKDIKLEFERRVKQVTDYFDRESIAYTQTTLKGANLATMTMNFAESRDGNLIVMMKEQEANVTGFLMGPFAQQIVNHSKIPVLSVSAQNLSAGSELFQALG